MHNKSDNILHPQSLTTEQVANLTCSNLKSGLNDNQVITNRNKYGSNVLTFKKKKSFFKLFLMQFKESMIIILLIATIISTIPLIVNTIKKNSNDITDIINPFIIVFIVIFNSLLGAFQQKKADSIINSLNKLMISKIHVIRNNKDDLIPANELVVGDIIYLEDGNNVCADARIIESNYLKVIESSLTGESISIDKQSELIDNKSISIISCNNMVFAGTAITSGIGKAIVTSVGNNTEIGKITKIVKENEKLPSHFQTQMIKLGKILTIICVAICVIVWIVKMIQLSLENEINNVEKIIDTIMISITLAVAAIPEGLPLAITITISFGVQKLLKEKVICKNLMSTENIGATTIICTDKTGTLTTNKMNIAQLYDFSTNQIIDVNKNTQLSDIQSLIIKYGSLCNTSNIKEENNEIIEIGDPTETSIILCLKNNLGISKYELLKDYSLEKIIPFDSNRKIMTTIYLHNNKHIVISKGSFENLIKKCVINQDELNKLNVKYNEMLNKGLRLLLVAYKEINSFNENSDYEKSMNVVGIIGINDIIRPNIQNSILECKKAGIKTVMITGDNVDTAINIGKNLGIYNENDIALTGDHLDSMSDDEYLKIIKNVSIYARITPLTKLRIVKTWQKLNQVVLMTGDGTNDAAALKAANIGCAMGRTGTDITKEAADIVLMDDNFKSITSGIKQGRGIYKNIIKVINFLISSNLAEILIISLIAFFGFWNKDVKSFEPIQILWINLISDSLPAVAIGVEKIDESIMFEKPRSLTKGIFTKQLWFKIIFESLMITIITISCYFIGYFCSSQLSRNDNALTFSFISLCLCEIVYIFNIKSPHSIFKKSIFNNTILNCYTIISIILSCLIVFIPQVSHIFKLNLKYDNELINILYVLLISFIAPFLIMEIEKIFFNRIIVKENKVNIKN